MSCSDVEDSAVVLAGHGSRRERSNQQVRALAGMLSERIDLPVEAGFIELAEPGVEAAVEELAEDAEEVSVVPLSLFAAGHVKNDLPLAVEKIRRGDVEVDVSYGRHLGVHPALLDVLDDRVNEVEQELDVDREGDDVAVVVCARGSSDPDSNGDVHKLARMLYEGRGFSRVEAAFEGVTSPKLADVLHRTAKARPDAVVVLPYMLGDGVLTQRIRDATEEFDEGYGYVDAAAGEPLGTDTRLLDVLADRWQEARTDTVDMSCDTCKYKVELDGYEEDVGGARAKLRALTHSELHGERGGDDDGHSHSAPERHVAVCTNRSCMEDGAAEVLSGLRKAGRRDGVDVRVTRSSCLDCCGEGPMVAVYPEGTWYGGVEADDVEEIANRHLKDGELVPELVHQTL